MGSRSSFSYQVGCRMDMSKIQLSSYVTNEKDKAELKTMGLGEYMDDWKIQGYWYKDYVKFLGECAKAMIGLTGDIGDNYIEMVSEEGLPFFIRFYIDDDDDIKVELECYSNETYTENLWSLKENRLEALK